MNVRIFWVHAMECMWAQTRPRFILSSKRVWGNGVRTHANSKGINPLYQGLRGGSNPFHCITQDSKPNTLPTELFLVWLHRTLWKQSPDLPRSWDCCIITWTTRQHSTQETVLVAHCYTTKTQTVHAVVPWRKRNTPLTLKARLYQHTVFIYGNNSSSTFSISLPCQNIHLYHVFQCFFKNYF